MQLVERMTGSPPNCMNCGRGNTPDTDGHVGPFLDFQREVNWGDDAYLCSTCGAQVAMLFGFTDDETLTEKDRIIQAKNKEIHNLKARIGRSRAKETAKA
jgi:DNA-directed RNA polymerase subunit RPC12/RpoP